MYRKVPSAAMPSVPDSLRNQSRDEEPQLKTTTFHVLAFLSIHLRTLGVGTGHMVLPLKVLGRLPPLYSTTNSPASTFTRAAGLLSCSLLVEYELMYAILVIRALLVNNNRRRR